MWVTKVVLALLLAALGCDVSPNECAYACARAGTRMVSTSADGCKCERHQTCTTDDQCPYAHLCAAGRCVAVDAERGEP